MTDFRATNSSLIGSFPVSLTTAINLDTLYLYSNSLSASIPASIGNLSKLTNLQLYDNDFTGIIPPELYSISTLTNLDLSVNQLTGTFAGIEALINLTFLSIQTTNISGIIPTAIGDISGLAFMNLSSNNLTGNIPASILSLTNLWRFAVSGNSLTGTIPAIQSITGLNWIFLNNNLYTGAQLDAFIVAEWEIRETRGSNSCEIRIQNNASGITEVDRIIGEGIYKYAIVNVNTASNWVEIAGDKTLDYPINSKFEIKGSTGNDAIGLIVTAVSFDGVNTRITTSSIPSAIDDGFVSDGLGIGGNGRGCNVTYTAA